MEFCQQKFVVYLSKINMLWTCAWMFVCRYFELTLITDTLLTDSRPQKMKAMWSQALICYIVTISANTWPPCCFSTPQLSLILPIVSNVPPIAQPLPMNVLNPLLLFWLQTHTWLTTYPTPCFYLSFPKIWKVAQNFRHRDKFCCLSYRNRVLSPITELPKELYTLSSLWWGWCIS